MIFEVSRLVILLDFFYYFFRIFDKKKRYLESNIRKIIFIGFIDYKNYV